MSYFLLGSLVSSDDLSLKILRELTSPNLMNWEHRQSYAALGRRFGVDEETVRNRIKRLADSGFLEGWRLIINPRLLGLELGSVILDVDDSSISKEGLISDLKLVDGVVLIFDFLHQGLRVAFYYEDARDFTRKVQLLRALSRSGSSFALEHYSPPCNMRLRKSDWDILKTLRKEPRKSISGIAAELKLSPKTVRRRLTLLVTNNVFYAIPLGNLRNLSDLAYYAIMTFDSTEKKKQADLRISERMTSIVYFDTHFAKFTAFAFFSKNISEGETLIQWLKELPGVDSVETRMMKDVIHTHEWFDREIEKHL